MGDLMRHNSGEFGSVIGVKNHTRIDKEKSARQGERVHLLTVDHLDRKRHFGVGVAGQVLSNRFTYSASTGSSVIRAWRFTSWAISFPSAISFSSQ
jgi:hypothetical protein